MRRAARTDANQDAIVRALEKTGATVQSLGAVGSGCPDLLVGRLGINVLLEVKQPGEKIRTDERGEKQRTFHASWRGQVAVVRDEFEAMEVVLKLTTGRG